MARGGAAAQRHSDALEHWALHGFGTFTVSFRGEAAGVITLNHAGLNHAGLNYAGLNHAGEGLAGIGADEIDLGWYTLPHLWGRGVAPEAAAAVVEWARGQGIGPLVV